jgi:hypothetical protein
MHHLFMLSTELALYSILVNPSAHHLSGYPSRVPSTSSTPPCGSLVQLHTSFKFNGTVVDFLACLAIISFSPYIVTLTSHVKLFYTYDSEFAILKRRETG